jgi:hypothetical protein
MATTTPGLMAVDDGARGLAALEHTVRCRYGHDYMVIGEPSQANALACLRELHAAGRSVAVPVPAGRKA